MFSSTKSMGVTGVGGYEVAVEVYISGGLPSFDIVGLPDAAVKEARERVRAAIKNSGFAFPVSRMTVNLAPADKKKAGTVYDLPMLVGILSASGDIKAPGEKCAFIGELSLTGRCAQSRARCRWRWRRSARGGAFLRPGGERGRGGVCRRAFGVPGEDCRPAGGAFVRGEAYRARGVPQARHGGAPVPDFADVKGQENVKRAFEIAAAGGHNILIVGPPGAGKSMMAKRLPGILPDMSREEMIETTEIHSVAGLTGGEHPIVSRRPFRAPHHTVSAAGLSGGGTTSAPGGDQPCAQRCALSRRAAGVQARRAGGAAPAA